jgi:uncharacterized protein (TIGR02996 family)
VIGPEYDLRFAIVRHFDDDGPRLLYADWLDEHGDAKLAAFIRAQVALSATTDMAGDAYTDAMKVMLTVGVHDFIAWADRLDLPNLAGRDAKVGIHGDLVQLVLSNPPDRVYVRRGYVEYRER